MESEALYDKVLSCAARMLARRALSEKGLYDKLLTRDFSSDAAEYAVQRLKFLGVLDDRLYAESAVRSLTNRGYGVIRIKQELKKRGISGEFAEEALSEVQPDMDVLTAFLDKKLKGDLSDRKMIQKAAAALQRKGFRWEQISAALRAYGAQLEEMETCL